MSSPYQQRTKWGNYEDDSECPLYSPPSSPRQLHRGLLGRPAGWEIGLCNQPTPSPGRRSPMAVPRWVKKPPDNSGWASYATHYQTCAWVTEEKPGDLHSRVRISWGMGITLLAGQFDKKSGNLQKTHRGQPGRRGQRSSEGESP